MQNLPSDIAQLGLDDWVDGTLAVEGPCAITHRPVEQLASNTASKSSYHETGSICITPKSSADYSRRRSKARNSPCTNLKENQFPLSSNKQPFGHQSQAEAASLPLARGHTLTDASSSCVINTPHSDPSTTNTIFSANPRSILRRKKKGTPLSQACVTNNNEEENVVGPMAPFSFNTPNAPSERSIPSRAHSTPIDSHAAATTPRTGKVKFNASTNFDLIGEKKLRKITSVVRESVLIFHSCNDKWRRLKQKGAKELDAIVGYKMDAHGNISRTISFVAVAHMVEMTSLLKDMNEMAFDMRTAVLEVANVDLAESEFSEVKPFKRLTLFKIMAMLNYLAKSFRADYTYRNKACTEVSRCCSYDAPVDRCVLVFSNIKSRWALEPNFDKNDAYLDTLVTEIGGLEAKK